MPTMQEMTTSLEDARFFNEGGNNSSRQPGLTEGNRRNYDYHARCAGLSTERSL